VGKILWRKKQKSREQGEDEWITKGPDQPENVRMCQALVWTQHLYSFHGFNHSAIE